MMDKFGAELIGNKVIILDIPDEYQFMDPELIEEIEVKVISYLT